MRLRVFTRLLVAAATMFLAAASMPALAQTADVTVTLTPPEHGTPAVVGINVGATNDYEAVLTNAGPDAATNVTLTVTALPAPLKIDAFGGCTLVPPTPPATESSACTLATLAVGATATIKLSVLYPTPDPVPTTCNTGETVGAVTVSVEAANDTTPATATVATTPVNEYVDLSVASTPVETGISSGGTLGFHVAVTNNGPCVAQGVEAEFAFPTALSFESSVDGTPAFCAGGVPLDDSPGDDTVTPVIPPGAFSDLGCVMGDLASGASRSFDAVFRLASLPDDLIRGVYAFTTTVAADTHDFKGANNSAASTGRFDDDSGGCSTGGAGTLLGLLSLVALRFGRRRSS